MSYLKNFNAVLPSVAIEDKKGPQYVTPVLCLTDGAKRDTI